MKLLEYEAKRILQTEHMPVPKSVVTDQSSAIFTLPAVIKSQVPIGGRGKLGGIQLVHTEEEARKAIDTLLSLPIKGHLPKKLLVEEFLEIQHEYYIAVIINKSTGQIEILAHTEGGIEVEEQSNFQHWPIQNNEESITRIGQELATYFGLQNNKVIELTSFVKQLITCFIKNDALLLEINPLILTVDSQLKIGDCKMTCDDAAVFRHPEWQFEETVADNNFVTLDTEGTIATIANGAGLAMATVDAVADAGFTPANFLDIGGGANEASVLKAFQQIMEYPRVTAIIINIFAGITRCDEVAKAIISAKSQIPNLPPLFIRLAGTNYELAETLLKKANTPLLPSLAECIATIKKEIK